MFYEEKQAGQSFPCGLSQIRFSFRTYFLFVWSVDRSVSGYSSRNVATAIFKKSSAVSISQPEVEVYQTDRFYNQPEWIRRENQFLSHNQLLHGSLAIFTRKKTWNILFLTLQMLQMKLRCYFLRLWKMFINGNSEIVSEPKTVWGWLKNWLARLDKK